jgi:hypothetical protein
MNWVVRDSVARAARIVLATDGSTARERAKLRVGPTLVTSHWRERYDSLGFVNQPPNPPAYLPVFAKSVDTAWNASAVGIALGAAW